MKKTLLVITALFISIEGLFSQDMFNARPLTSDPAQEAFPTWSPDGKSIVYQYSSRSDSAKKNGLWSLSLEGGMPRQIFKGLAEHPRWSPDGRYIVFDADTGRSIRMIPSHGGDPINFLPDSIKIMNGGLPCWSPDGSMIAFLEGTTLSLCIYDMNSGITSRVFSKEGMLPLPGCWSHDGKGVLIALMDMKTRQSTIWKISPDGKGREQITGHHENLYRYLAISPDGSLLVYGVFEEGTLGLYIMLARGGRSLPLAASANGHNEGASWSPDGSKIAFNSTRSQNFDIWIMDIDLEKVRRELGALNR